MVSVSTRDDLYQFGIDGIGIETIDTSGIGIGIDIFDFLGIGIGIDIGSPGIGIGIGIDLFYESWYRQVSIPSSIP